MVNGTPPVAGSGYGLALEPSNFLIRLIPAAEFFCNFHISFIISNGDDIRKAWHAVGRQIEVFYSC
jgi:hypothetical protein